MGKLSKLYRHMQKRVLSDAERSQDIYEGYMNNLVNSETVWLDLGCGHQLLRSYRWGSPANKEKAMVNQCKTLYGLDYDYEGLKRHRSIQQKINGDIFTIPFKDNIFDIITCNMVLEHLDNPKEQFKEIHRVLKDNGLFIFHTPNRYSCGALLSRLLPESFQKILIKKIDLRAESDTFKTYYLANSENKVLEIAKETGFLLHEFNLVIEAAARFARFPAIAIFELLYLKMLTMDFLRKFRTNIVCVLRKSPANIWYHSKL